MESLHAVFVSVWQMGRRLYDGGTEDEGCHGLLLLHTESGNNQREKVYRRIAGKGGIDRICKTANLYGLDKEEKSTPELYFNWKNIFFQKEWKIGGLIQKSFLMKRLVSIFIRETEMKNG